MPWGFGLAELAKWGLALGNQARYVLSTVQSSIQNPIQAAEKILDFTAGFTTNNIGRLNRRQISTEMSQQNINLGQSRVNVIDNSVNRVGSGINDTTSNEPAAIEVDCINLKTGAVTTHAFLVSRDKVDAMLSNPMEENPDHEFSGCSGDLNVNYAIQVRVL